MGTLLVFVAGLLVGQTETFRNGFNRLIAYVREAIETQTRK